MMLWIRSSAETLFPCAMLSSEVPDCSCFSRSVWLSPSLSEMAFRMVALASESLSLLPAGAARFVGRGSLTGGRWGFAHHFGIGTGIETQA
jgi:hypothetical protein